MARDHTQEKDPAPQVVEREINLGLINAKLNEITNIVYKIAEKQGIDLED